MPSPLLTSCWTGAPTDADGHAAVMRSLQLVQPTYLMAMSHFWTRLYCDFQRDLSLGNGTAASLGKVETLTSQFGKTASSFDCDLGKLSFSIFSGKSLSGQLWAAASTWPLPVARTQAVRYVAAIPRSVLQTAMILSPCCCCMLFTCFLSPCPSFFPFFVALFCRCCSG